MAEINLLKSLPKSKRNISSREDLKTDEHINISRKYGIDYFDGAREYGYGGYKYDGRWKPVAQDIIDHFNLKKGDKLLDVGCAKGFLVKDLCDLGIEAFGLDISDYAIKKSMPEIKDRLIKGSADKLPFDDNYFDITISINTIHNLDRKGCIKALREISRVSNSGSFIQVDSYLDKKQKEIFESWVLTAKYYGYPNEWLELFNEANYTGDWYWTIIK